MIPEHLQQYPLIRVCRPNCRSHGDCNSPGKRPVTSVEDDEPVNEIENWIEDGGNYGVVARKNNDLVIFDSDSEQCSELLLSHLGDTLRVESGGHGHGEHIYYQCKEAERNTSWDDPEGSVRVSNWMCVGPGSTHPETGDEYELANGISPLRKITSVNHSDLLAVYEKLDNLNSVNKSTNDSVDTNQESVKSGGRRRPPSSHRYSAPEELDFIRRDDKRREIAEVLKTDSRHDERVWMVGWLHGAAGLTVDEISDLIINTADWPSVDEGVIEQQVKSVVQSSRNDRGTHYSKFGTADMDVEASERRKTESIGDHESPIAEEVNTDMVDYNDHEEVTILEGNEDGDSFKKVVRTTREEDGETVEYVSIKTGRVELVETVDGDEVLARRVNDSTSLGSPDYIGDLAEALQELDGKING